MTEDLDTQIRRAEMTVVESDRRLLQTARQLATASRGAAQRAAWIGGGSLAVIASTWLVVRALSRPAPPPHEWPARKAPNGPPPPPARPPLARGWPLLFLMELGGALMGSALRSGLAPAAPKTAVAAPLAFATAWRWFSRHRASRR